MNNRTPYHYLNGHLQHVKRVMHSLLEWVRFFASFLDIANMVFFAQD